MENTEENLNLQREEIEALSSIYDHDFKLDEEHPPTFSIVIPLSEAEVASLLISFPAEYPNSAPPTYQLSVPWLRGEEKKEICSSLEEIYLEHMGENIVYMWVEKLRDFLQERKGKEINVVEKPNDSNAIDSSDDKYDLPLSPGIKLVHDKISLPEIFTGDPFTDRKSTFQAHIAPINDERQVKLVLEKLLENKKIAAATHNIYAYRVSKGETNTIIQDCGDDGETHAGSRLLHLLEILDCRNVVVIVTRWFGGIHLHGDRFKHINNVARQLLEQKGFIPEKKSSGSKKLAR